MHSFSQSFLSKSSTGQGGAGVVAYASKAHDGSVHVLVANHEVSVSFCLSLSLSVSFCVSLL